MISIIIPCYNHNHLLSRAVKSALSQRVDKEIIVIDDGSKEPICNIWGDPVRVLQHDRNRGLSHALNTGIAHSKGDRFVILAADDELNPAHLPTLSQSNADIVSCDMLVGGKHIRGRPGDLKTLMSANCHSYAALIKRWVWDKAGGFNPYMNPSWEDYEFFLHAAKLGATWAHYTAPFHIYHHSNTGRDAQAQGKDYLLRGKLEGFHQDLFGLGAGLVTFIIPCYNHEQYLAEAVNSALNQTYPHIRVVVVDDGSPGSPECILKELDTKSVTLIRQRNKHLSGARNTGIKTAIDKFNSQYVIPLDADDAVHTDFVESVMGFYEPNRYVYTDVQFIGDAWHQYHTQDYSCELLTKKHIHPCTVFMPSILWQGLVNNRGYGYDETMKRGYEDWEFALAAVEIGYCGKRLPKPLFNYRFHQNGSMRTQADNVNGELVQEIRDRHPWITKKETVQMGCGGGCGGSKYTGKQIITKNGTGGITMAINVPGVGVLDGRQPIRVTYTGSKFNTTTKVGIGGTIYKFSGDPNNRRFPPTFTVFARDIHLFNGPFVYERMEVEQPKVEIQQRPIPQPTRPIPQPVSIPKAVKPVEVIAEERMFAPQQDRLAEKLEAKAELDVEAFEPDDFTTLKGVGETGAKKLKDAGFSFYEDIADAAVEELASVLGVGKAKAKAIQTVAEEALEQL